MNPAPCRFLAAVALAATVAGCALDPPAPPPTPVDLKRLSGTWFVIAAGSQFAGAGTVGCTVEFRPPSGEKLDVARSCHDHSFDAPASVTEVTLRPLDAPSHARWRTPDPWPFSKEWRVLYAGPEYRVALVGGASRGQAQVLARERLIEPWIYAGLLARLSERGYHVGDLRRVPQRLEDVGRSGFY